MSVVAIPFKDENNAVVLANLETAASHPRVDEVWAIGSDQMVSDGARRITGETGTTVELIADRRIGSLRPGKGDAMNTALIRAADESIDRLHFY
ncbi:MAG: hypothetical protein KDB69_04920, partial [Acidimicrobiia bacterium]|nr:hypothetical protein [Acidimicrobiia bacterium]